MSIIDVNDDPKNTYVKWSKEMSGVRVWDMRAGAWRLETRAERAEREQLEAASAQEQELRRLSDLRATLLLRETQYADAILKAKELLERNTRYLKENGPKLTKAQKDFAEAEANLRDMLNRCDEKKLSSMQVMLRKNLNKAKAAR